MHLPQRSIYGFAACLWICGVAPGCKLVDRFMQEPTSEVKEAAVVKPLQYDASVADGAIRTRAVGKSAWLQEAHDQLAYASGQLREVGGLMDPDRVEVELDTAKMTEDAGVTTIPFKAKFPVSWSGEVATPPSLTLYLPKGGDHDARQAFFTAYQQSCADPAAQDLALRSFWYHYRPNRPTCDIGKGTFDRSLVARPTLLLTAKSK